MILISLDDRTKWRESSEPTAGSLLRSISNHIKVADLLIKESYCRELYMGRLHRMANHFDDPLVLERAQQVSWVTIHRVCGELAVSRSIGETPSALLEKEFLLFLNILA